MARKTDETDYSLIVTEAAKGITTKPTVATTPATKYIGDGLETNTTYELAKAMEGAFAADVFGAMTTHNAGVAMRGTQDIDAMRLEATTPQQLANNTAIAKGYSEEIVRGVSQINTEAKNLIIQRVGTSYREPAPPPKKKNLLQRIVNDE